MMSRTDWVFLLFAFVATEATAQCVSGQVTNGGTAVTETTTVRLQAIGPNQSVTVGTLVLSCTTGSPNANQVGAFFENQSTANGAGNAAPTGCTKSGNLGSWTSGAASAAPSSTRNVTFTSTTANSNVDDLNVAGAIVSATTTQGSSGNALTTLLTGSLVCARPAAGYNGNMADRWQEQHRTNGELWDYKQGPNAAKDREKKMGGYSFSGTGTGTTVTHAYGSNASNAYSWTVYLHSAPNTYSFCNGSTEVVRALVIAGAGVSGSGCSSFPP